MALRAPLFHDATSRFTDEMDATADEISIGKVTLAGISGVSLDGGNGRAINFANPVGQQDLVTKSYADALAEGQDIKASVRVATTANLAATRTGNVLTATANGALSVDGVSPAVGNRILVKNQTTGADNGIYVVTDAGSGGTPFILTRSSDADLSAEVTAGMYTFVSEGTTQADTGWTLITDDPITLNTTSLTFTQYNGAGTYIAGNGLTLTGNTFDVGDGAGILVNANSVEVDLATDPALEFDAGGAAGKLRFKPDTSRGLNRDAAGAYVAISATPGLEFSAGLLQVLVDPNGGVERVAAGIKAKLDGTTLQSNGSGLSVRGLPSLFEVNGVAVGATVTAANLDTLTNGSNADALHTHASAAATEVLVTYTSSGSITKGQGVYISGSGLVSAGDCSVDAESLLIGVANQSVATGQPVQVSRIGLVTGVLSGASPGAEYWLGASGSPVLLGGLPTVCRTIKLGYAKNATDLEVFVQDLGKKRS